MTTPHPPASELLPLMVAAFPQTFFAEPKQVRPLKINIHQDLEALFQAGTLPEGLDPSRIKRFLRGYTRRTCYLKALARGEGRVDLTGAVVDTDIPVHIRQRAQQEAARRQPPQASRKETGPAATADRSAALLSRMADAFPQTFFTKPAQVQPLKAFLYRDLLRLAQAGTLPDGLDRARLKPFLRWYGGRTSYLNALARGAGRIDLTGAVVTTEIPEALRHRAREEAQRRRQQQAARTSAPADAAPPRAAPQAASPAAHPAATINPEELYAMAVDAKLEITLKFSTLPNAQPVGQGKMAFALKTPNGQYVTAEVGNKVWNKLVKANTEWPQWVAALSGTMGERTEKGFALANPGLQIFEKKVKGADATATTDTLPAPPPAAPVAPSPPAPVTISTGAGPATVTVTKRAPLGLKRNAST